MGIERGEGKSKRSHGVHGDGSVGKQAFCLSGDLSSISRTHITYGDTHTIPALMR